MDTYELRLDERVSEAEWSRDRCDQYDYMIAAFFGLAAGAIDAFLVGAPGQSKIGLIMDRTADNFVQKLAVMLWQGDGRSTMDGKSHRAPETLEKAISYLEQAFPVSYDARYASDLQNPNGALQSMAPGNHHLLSLAHSPDIIGLLFSIFDQFTGAASFIDGGQVIRLIPVKDGRNNKVSYMQGTNIHSKIFCGICNWLGHLASDLCGSSSTRRTGKTGRGAGIPIPFYELFLNMDFGNFDGATFSEIAVRVFKEGYDFRYGVAMAIPVMIAEISIKLVWVLKRHYYEKREWGECIPSSKHADLRMMLIVGDAALCLVDLTDAAIHSMIKGRNIVTFILHLNVVAWFRLIMLVFKELLIRYGGAVTQAIEIFLSKIGFNDRYALHQYYDRMRMVDQRLDEMLREFVAEAEREYRIFIESVNNSLNPNIGTAEQRRINSVEFAQREGVPLERQIRNAVQMKNWIEEGWK